MNVESATMRDGARIRYKLRPGTERDDRLVLVHSLAMTAAFWDDVVARLPAEFSVLTYDCRGHGGSDKIGAPYSAEQFGDDLDEVLDAVGWDRATVAGCSMGGCVALAFAARHSDRLAGLGLIDTTAWYGPDAPTQWAERAGKAAENGLESLIGFQRTRWVSEEFLASHPETVGRYEAIFLDNELEAYGATCRMLGAVDLRDELSGIAVPTTIIVGEQDYATPPAMAEAMHREIVGSTLTVLKNIRHFSPIEAPELIAGALTGLVRDSEH